MGKFPFLLAVLCCFSVCVIATNSLEAQTKKEICDNGKDDDGDKLVDCDDPDCDKVCDEGEPCSPGYWKNHTEVWFGVCCEGAVCEGILADLQARGHGSSAIRQAAADFLEACLGRPCNDVLPLAGEVEVADAVQTLNRIHEEDSAETLQLELPVSIAALSQMFQAGPLAR